MTLVGAPQHPASVDFNLLMKQRRIADSAIDGIRETRERLDFCREKGITAVIDLIKIQKVKQAYEPLLKSDVK